MQDNTLKPLCLISGGGATAELMACALAQNAVKSRLFAPPVAAESQARTVAIWQAGLNILHEILGDDSFLQYGYPIRHMTLIDEKGQEKSYFPADIDLEGDYFGYNLPLQNLSDHARRINDASNHVERITGRTERWVEAGHVYDSHGTEHHAELVIVAEGKDSATAKAAGIAPVKCSHGTVAVIANVYHAQDHEGGTREYHRRPGPLAFVPMEAHHSSIVWVRHPGAKTEELMRNQDLFLQELNAHSRQQLDVQSLVSTPKTIPLTSSQSLTFRAPRMALIGETAHKMPPTGAQGLNLSLRDIHALQELLTSANQQNQDLGSDYLLKRYSQERLADTLAVSAAVHLANSSIKWGGPMAALRRGIQHRLLPYLPRLEQRLIRTAIYGLK